MECILNTDDTRIAYAEKCELTLPQITGLYRAHTDKPYFPDLVGSVNEGVIKLILVGPDMVARWRGMIGPTDPKNSSPHHIRYWFMDEERLADNGVHGSDSPASAIREMRLMLTNGWYDMVMSLEHMRTGVSWG